MDGWQVRRVCGKITYRDPAVQCYGCRSAEQHICSIAGHRRSQCEIYLPTASRCEVAHSTLAPVGVSAVFVRPLLPYAEFSTRSTARSSRGTNWCLGNLVKQVQLSRGEVAAENQILRIKSILRRCPEQHVTLEHGTSTARVRFWKRGLISLRNFGMPPPTTTRFECVGHRPLYRNGTGGYSGPWRRPLYRAA